VPGAVPESGAILSSGLSVDVEGPNDSDANTYGFEYPGDDDLDDLIPGYTTYDACILEFQFQCPPEMQGTSADLTFDYVFGSEEYNEYVGSSYNDVFGFFLNGDNIALLPDGASTPVAINNVNNGVGSAYYNDNDPSTTVVPFDTQADGFTTKLNAAGPVNAGLNTMKLAIADAGDFVLDSWVLIESGSFGCTTQNCNEFKGCHKNNSDKRAICHRQGKPNTLCLPAEAISAHLAEHPNDTCGCCLAGEEKRRPDFCDEWGI
jgi:hypothetical protein